MKATATFLCIGVDIAWDRTAVVELVQTFGDIRHRRECLPPRMRLAVLDPNVVAGFAPQVEYRITVERQRLTASE